MTGIIYKGDTYTFNNVIWDNYTNTWKTVEVSKNKYYLEDEHLDCCLDCLGLGYMCEICSFAAPC